MVHKERERERPKNEGGSVGNVKNEMGPKVRFLVSLVNVQVSSIITKVPFSIQYDQDHDVCVSVQVPSPFSLCF